MQLAIPNEWQDVLKQVQAVFPSAVIAGGALRDLLCGKPIKDVDIFVPVHLEYTGTVEAAGDAIWSIFLSEEIYLDQAAHYGTIDDDAHRDLHAIFKLRRTYDYDIILCTPEAARCETFDINLCQITYNGEVLKFTGDFVTGFLQRNIKVCNVNRTDRNQKRLDRLSVKYTDYTIQETT